MLDDNHSGAAAHREEQEKQITAVWDLLPKSNGVEGKEGTVVLEDFLLWWKSKGAHLVS
jgi:hypothetical protein